MGTSQKFRENLTPLPDAASPPSAATRRLLPPARECENRIASPLPDRFRRSLGRTEVTP
jgi:hypothetical protein